MDHIGALKNPPEEYNKNYINVALFLFTQILGIINI